MSKKSTVTYSTIKDYLPKLWTFWACNENEVYYLIESKKIGTMLWKTLDEIQDSRDMIVWHTNKDANDVLKELMKKGRYPQGTTHFQLGEVIPSYEGGYWYEDTPGKCKDIKVK
jgi:hypothetical protein